MHDHIYTYTPKVSYTKSNMASDSMFHLGVMTLSRQSTIGCSSRIYYRNPEGIPFKWEEEPGKPIEPQPNEALPPLSPPPAFLSLGLPKSNIELEDDTKGHKRLSPRWLWKHIKRKVKKRKDINKAILEVFRKGKMKSPISDPVENVLESEGGGDNESDLWKFDGEKMRVTPRSSVSSSLSSSKSLSSSSSLTSKEHSLEASKYHHPGFTCSPRNIGGIMASYLVKRA